MFLGSTVFGALGALTTWVLVQWLLRRVAPQNAVVRSINYFLQAVIDHVVFGCGTLVALLLLSPYLLGVASELFRFLRTQVASLESKSLLDWVAHILEKLDVIGKEMRQASTNLEENCPTDTKRIDQRLRNDSVVSPGPSALSQSCGKVLLAVSEYNKSLDRLFSALQPTELEEMIYCDCEESELRSQRIQSVLGMLTASLKEQTKVAEAMGAVCLVLSPNLALGGDEDTAWTP
ncbi:hypothetical protein BU26DRAFT_560605 [Trematosphaeria pertusa]|uniref:Uncharacterized protein n=1 Tax=Trematosphaeria pertusa TaxID=390896 RepID=A0A6A6IRX2_9PLEO|nr:uncharacterized protein BU26DRAFT_560605 [Trematosphaeria pertusa]KAF2253285.1 hypothetical protein BU26DRAFT_560605 [Trematosphaeria pertusa]